MHTPICTTLFFFLFLANTGNAQTGLRYTEKMRVDLMNPAVSAPDVFFDEGAAPPPLRSIILPSAVPGALFCRLEWQLEKQIELPVRVRLGSVDYVDWLEGKRRRYD